MGSIIQTEDINSVNSLISSEIARGGQDLFYPLSTPKERICKEFLKELLTKLSYSRVQQIKLLKKHELMKQKTTSL
jgi:hypothetical protein